MRVSRIISAYLQVFLLVLDDGHQFLDVVSTFLRDLDDVGDALLLALLRRNGLLQFGPLARNRDQQIQLGRVVLNYLR